MASLLETLVNDGRFDTFVSAIQASNLAETVGSTDPLTVFAPTDDGFAGLPEGVVDRIMDDIPSLTRLVTYHLVSGRLALDAVVAQEKLVTVAGASLKSQRLDEHVFVNDAQVVDGELLADNGLIYAIDAVLLPPEDG